MKKAFLLLVLFTCFAVLVKAQTSLAKQPLFIVDGKLVEEPTNDVLSAINPKDIESIEVLKDASAAALWGSRGVNGVVYINTKVFAVKNTQKKLSTFSKQYRRYLKSNADVSNITYAIDGRELVDTTMSIPRDVVGLSEKTIQRVEFTKPKANQKGTLKITTTPKN